jgi:hypothetical protein
VGLGNYLLNTDNALIVPISTLNRMGNWNKK